MRTSPLRRLLFLLVFCVPSWASAVTLDPGQPGNYFTYTSVGNVDALDAGGFDIQFADGKYITITPYATDARFLFGIDFNSSGLDPVSITGYLTDETGNEIAGTAFTGTAISAGFGGGAIILNEVVVAYGARIDFTGTPPATPFPVRLGSGVSSNVFEDRPVIGQGDPEPPGISIDSASACTGPAGFEFSISATGTTGEMVVSIGADTAPDPALGPTERITTQFNALTGEINSEAEPIAESFGTPPFDRWLDGYLDEFTVTATGDSGSSWTFSGTVPHGNEPFAAGDEAWGVTLSENDAEVSLEPLSITACDPVIGEISVPAGLPPVLDGHIGYREWRFAPQVELEGGTITFMHDEFRLYMLVNMREDDSDNPLRDGGVDQVSLVVDVDEDGEITPDVDRRYRILPENGNFRFETYAQPGGEPFNPPEDINFSALGEGFSCFLADGSATISPLSCFQHRVWEIGIDLLEIQASGDKTARLGLEVQSETDVIERLPTDLGDLGDFLSLRLEGRTNLDEPSRGLPTTPLSLAELRITQGVQDADNGMPLVASREAYADVLVETPDSFDDVGESVTTSLFVARDGVDLPGSPFTWTIRYNVGWGTSNRRAGSIRAAIPLEADDMEGLLTFRLITRQPLLDARLDTPEYPVETRPTDTPVYWIVPVNTGDGASPNLPGNDFLLRSQLEVETAFPVREVDFVRRPPIIADPDSAEDAIALLNQYDQQAVLAWTLGLLITGESPFDLPDQIIGAFPGDQTLSNFLGMSDPRWWFGGAARVVWIKEVIADAGLLLPHELNHNLDTNIQGSWGRHVSGCGSTGLDSQWPYGDRTIQEPALVTGEVLGRNDILLQPPRRVAPDVPDYMSYCTARYSDRDTDREAYPFQWVSPYRWFRQLNEAFETSASVSTLSRSSLNRAATATVQDAFYITGRIFSDGTGSLDPVLRQPGVVRAGHLEGEYSVQLLDCLNVVLSSASFDASPTNVEGGARESTPFAMVLPEDRPVCEVQLVAGSEVLARRPLSPNTPEVTLLAPVGGEDWTGVHTIRWDASDQDGDALTATLQYSPDAGASWLPVAGGLSGGEYEIDSRTLPGSDQALVRVLVTDGLNTADDQSDATFQVSSKAPSVRIVTPAANGELFPGEPVTLRGIARDTVGRELPDDSFVWRLDGEPIAVGNGASALLPPGERQLSLQATASNGLSGQASITLQVPGPDGDGDGVPDDQDSCPNSLPGSLVTVADCPTDVENRLDGNGCALEELVNTTLEQSGRDALVELLKVLRKSDQLAKEEVKAIKQCVSEEDGD